MKIVEHPNHPVFVRRFAKLSVELGIGESKPGKARYAYLGNYIRNWTDASRLIYNSNVGILPFVRRRHIYG